MLTLSDWLAVATIALPLFIKALTDWQANAVANHNAFLARIVGMAGREAAMIARVVQQAGLDPQTTKSSLETNLVKASVDVIVDEMGHSMNAIGASSENVQTIVQGELNKLLPPIGVNK